MWVGTLRAAADASEVDAALVGFECILAVIALACVLLGTLVGWLAGRRQTDAQDQEFDFEDRLAA